MTRRFDSLVQCPHCKEFHTAETAFERWMRNHEKLDSRLYGIVRYDCDILLHKYMVHEDKRGRREIQVLMFIEVKTRGADLDINQLDSLSLWNQVLRNRNTNMHQDKLGRHALDHTPLCKAYSKRNKRMVRLKLWGGHLLRLSHDSPEDSEWMLWNNKPITIDELLRLLKVELDPDTLRPIDWRRRYSDHDQINSQTQLFAL